MKTVLVNFGENRRIVSFSSVPAPTTDAEALAKAIKETFSDILKPEQDFFLQVKTDESGAWGGVFIDVLKQEIVDKAVINVVIIQKPIQEVSHCAFLNIKSFNICWYSLIQAMESMPPLSGHDDAKSSPSVEQSTNKVQSHQWYDAI